MEQHRKKASRYATQKQVADYFNVHPVTVWRWEKQGILKSKKFAGTRRYDWEEVESL